MVATTTTTRSPTTPCSRRARIRAGLRAASWPSSPTPTKRATPPVRPTATRTATTTTSTRAAATTTGRLRQRPLRPLFSTSKPLLRFFSLFYLIYSLFPFLTNIISNKTQNNINNIKIVSIGQACQCGRGRAVQPRARRAGWGGSTARSPGRPVRGRELRRGVGSRAWPDRR